MELSFAQKKILWKIGDDWTRYKIGIEGLDPNDYPRIEALTTKHDLMKDQVNALVGHLLRIQYRSHEMTTKERTEALQGIKTLLTKCHV